MMSGECDRCGNHTLECVCIDPSPWPKNWREITDKSPSCDRCGSRLMSRRYCLSEQFPDILICRSCSEEYWGRLNDFIKDFIEQMRENGC